MNARLDERLGKVFLVASEEWPPLLYLTCFNALLVGGLVVALSVAGSLFLRRVGPDALPGMYLLSALVILIVSPVYFALWTRCP
ncbi:MAG: hypothetical protein HY726_21870 [Candidatus Rokubacteria bacterium]|nr:hypothetical protein [Candidatus Rokubacteria bacterium]